MTIAVCQAFDAFAKFPLSDPTQEDKDKLLRGVGVSTLTLLGLTAAALIFSSITLSLWIATGERNLRALHRCAYHIITNKEMVWFDQKMGSDDSLKTADSEDGPIGAGGMVAQFVKCAYFILCPSYCKFLTLAQRSPRRPFSIFPCSWVGHSIPDRHSGRPYPRLPGFMVTHPCCFIHLPILILLGGLSRGLSQNLLMGERSYTAIAATLVDRAVAAIATVKAFNAFNHELKALRVDW